MQTLEDSLVVLRSLLAEQMTLYVFVAEEAVRIYVLQDTDEVVEPGIQLAEVVRAQRMRFGPVRPPTMPNHDAFEAFKQLSVGHVQAVRSVAIGWCECELLAGRTG